ncbi:MAG: acetoacetate decarboxylase family protein [Solirubrobacteraceae bacterium]|nr:acetoacetate decarboxylase family protein [Solirubrobacteraceae bacterium]
MTPTPTPTDRERIAIPSIPESALTDELLAALPEEPAPAPWELRARSVMWWGRSGRGARDLVPPAIRRGGRTVGRVGAFIRYESTPVGSYDEIIGAIAVRRGRGVVGHVPFIVVDSAPSVLGGRSNWLLPKGLAEFHGDPGADMTARGDGWQVRARVRAFGPALPWSGAGAMLEQLDGFGAVHRTRMGRVRMRMRPAIVRVEVHGGDELRSTVPDGRCVGVVLERFETTLGPAVPVDR